MNTSIWQLLTRSVAGGQENQVGNQANQAKNTKLEKSIFLCSLNEQSKSYDQTALQGGQLECHMNIHIFIYFFFFYHSLISLKFEDSVKPSGTFPESFTSCSPAPHPTPLRDNKDAADQVSLIVWRSVQLYLVTQSNDSQKQQS